MTDQESADLTFLALTVWREARGEPFLAKAGVAFSILNRVKRPCWWGRDIMSVVGRRWQYSAMTAPGDPNLVKWPLSTDPSWQESLRAARLAILGEMANPVNGSDSYFDLSIPAPYWATSESYVTDIGRLKFHDVDMDHEGTA